MMMAVDGDVTFTDERAAAATPTLLPVDRNWTLAGSATAVAAASSDLPARAGWFGDVVAALIGVVLSAVVLGTLLGNASVILAVAVYDKMRTLSNALIASLASADLLVAIVVMPISLQVRPRPPV